MGPTSESSSPRNPRSRSVSKKKKGPPFVQSHLPFVDSPSHEETKKMKELVERRAMEWARECGMKGQVTMTEPEQHPFGWTVHLQDEKGRIAPAGFMKDGRPSF